MAVSLRVDQCEIVGEAEVKRITSIYDIRNLKKVPYTLLNRKFDHCTFRKHVILKHVRITQLMNELCLNLEANM